MEQCDQKIKIHDDRWGTMTAQCELGMNHEEKRHQVSMNACTPIGLLTWEA